MIEAQIPVVNICFVACAFSRCLVSHASLRIRFLVINWRHFSNKWYLYMYVSGFCSDQTICELIFLRPLSVYLMGHESADEMKLSLTEKKIDIWVLFYFFLPHAEKRVHVYSFPKSVVFSAPKQPKFSKCLRQEKIWPMKFVFFFSFLFPPTKHRNICRDPAHIEYTENGLR